MKLHAIQKFYFSRQKKWENAQKYTNDLDNYIFSISYSTKSCISQKLYKRNLNYINFDAYKTKIIKFTEVYELLLPIFDLHSLHPWSSSIYERLLFIQI